MVNGPLTVSGSSPALNMQGSITAPSLTIDNHGVFAMAATGKVYTEALELSAWSVTTVADTAVFGNDVTKIAVGNFKIGYKAHVTFDQSELAIESTSFTMDSLSTLVLGGQKKKLTLTSGAVYIQDGAVISVAGGGNLDDGTGSTSGTAGASYGGVGGNSSVATYGSALQPVDYGSGSTDCRGGGIVRLVVSGTAEIDGLLSAAGQGSNMTGGASGGSIYVEAATLQGHGQLVADGGDSEAGGGGGGGRIAIHVTTLSSFLGHVTAYGGTGMQADGAAGSIYKQYQQSGGAQFKTITIDNNGRPSDSYSHVPGITSITDLFLYGYGQVKFDMSSLITIGKVTGDYTGTLTISAGQRYSIATSYGTLSPYGLQFKLKIEEGGQATIPSKILLTDNDSTGQDWNNLEVYGTVIGVREMTVASGGKVLVHSRSRSGVDSNNLNAAGTLGFNTIDVTTDGVLELALDSVDMYNVVMVKKLSVKYGGTVQGRHLVINSPNIQVSSGGSLHVNGGNLNPGAAPGEAGMSGAGGSLGGKGGQSLDGATPTALWQGTHRSTGQFGSAGGAGSNETGANGGGVLELRVSTLLNVEGTISADGDDASHSAGGGSGGSVYIKVEQDMTGSGKISVRGGSSTSGGGGGGGRLTVDVARDYHFLGDFSLCGGSSVHAQAGGSGSGFARIQEAGTPGIVNNIYFDNSCAHGTSAGVAYIPNPDSNILTVNRLTIGDKTIVQLATEGVHYKALSLDCGTGSTITVGDNTVFSPDYELTYSAISCSFDLRPAGELRLPKSVELRGEASSLEGTAIIHVCF